MREYIGKKMIEDGLMAKVIVPELTDGGLICHIGEYWFYFGGSEFEYVDPDDITFATKVEEIKMALDSFYEEEHMDDEYLYYYYYLCENI